MRQLNQMSVASNDLFGSPEVVKIVQAPIPVPLKNQILVRVCAATVSSADARLRSKNVPRGFGLVMGLLFGFRRPKYKALGTNVAGVVDAVGESVAQFQVGDRVVADLGMSLGGHAQFKVLNETDVIAKVPQEISFAEAAALVFGGLTSLVFLRDKVELKAGERLLVIGGGGEVGSAALQIGLYMGAHVTAVCSSKKVSALNKIGVQEIINYQEKNWKEAPEVYDVIFDTVGGTEFQQIRHKLNTHGRLVLVIADLVQTLKSGWISMFQKQKLIAGGVQGKAQDLQFLLTLCKNGEFKPLVGQVFPFDKIALAHELVDSGHKLGSVVIDFELNGTQTLRPN